MKTRSVRYQIERPVDFRLTDVRGAPRQQGRTLNISSSGVLIQTDEKIGVGRKMEIIVRMAKLSPDSVEVDLRLLGISVRSGDGWVAVQVKKHQILPGADSRTPTSLPGKHRDSDKTRDKPVDHAA